MGLRIWFALALLPAGLSLAAQQPILRIPFVPESKIIQKVEPEYPARALRHRIEGTVRFTAVIGESGRVQYLRLISGHPLLVDAARYAAADWVYEPAVQDGRRVRFVTIIDIEFRLPKKGGTGAPPVTET